jgi:DNA-binding GntR family transcriptional regulator
LQAVERHDRDGAREAMRIHLEQVREDSSSSSEPAAQSKRSSKVERSD